MYTAYLVLLCALFQLFSGLLKIFPYKMPTYVQAYVCLYECNVVKNCSFTREPLYVEKRYNARKCAFVWIAGWLYFLSGQVLRGTQHQKMKTMYFHYIESTIFHICLKFSRATYKIPVSKLCSEHLAILSIRHCKLFFNVGT